MEIESTLSTANIEKAVLSALATAPIADTTAFSAEHKIPKEVLDPVLKSLDAEEYVSLAVIEKKFLELTDEGKGYAQNGSPEF